MNVTAQLARNSGLKVCVNHKVNTTAADNNKQGDVQAMDFGIPGYEHLVWDVSLESDRIGSSLQLGLNGKLQLGDYLNARARTKIGKFRRDYAAKNITFAPAILSVAGKIHPEFLRLLWVLADMQTVSTSISLGTKRTSGMNDSSGVGLAHSAIIGMQLALPLHTLQPYKLICWYMAPLTP